MRTPPRNRFGFIITFAILTLLIASSISLPRLAGRRAYAADGVAVSTNSVPRPSATAQFTVAIDPKASYLHTNSDPGAVNTVPIDLAANGLQAGDAIALEQLGSFSSSQPGSNTAMIAVFSSSSALNGNDTSAAIGFGMYPIVTARTLIGNQGTDIYQDFWINNLTNGNGSNKVGVKIPNGAQYLFVAANDNYFSDNTSNGFAVRITKICSTCNVTVPAVGNANDQITWTATGCGDSPVTLYYRWGFGEGSSVGPQSWARYNVNTPTITFGYGAYHQPWTWELDVSLDPEGGMVVCHKSGVITISQGPGCVVAATAFPPTEGAAGSALGYGMNTFPQGCGNNPQPTFDWDFGDGSAHATTQNPLHTYAIPGSYNWKVTASMPNALPFIRRGTTHISCSITCAATVPGTGEANKYIPFIATQARPNACNQAADYSWSFGDGTSNTSEPNPNHLYTDPGTYNWRLSVNGVCEKTGTITIAPRPSLEVLGIEVTQGIQDFHNSVELISGRHTFVRVFAKLGTSTNTYELVKGTLTATRNGVQLDQPLDSTIYVFRQPDPSRTDPLDSFNFNLPNAWLTGTIALEFNTASHSITQCGGGSLQTATGCKAQAFPVGPVPPSPSLSFTASPKLGVNLIAITRGHFDAALVNQEREQTRKEIEALFPVATVETFYKTGWEDSSLPTDPAFMGPLIEQLQTMRAFDCLKGLPQCNNYYLGLLIEQGLHKTGRAENIPGNVAVAYTLDHTPSHELGHIVGRYHTDFNRQRNEEPREDGADSNYRPLDGSISETSDLGGFVGLDINRFPGPYSLYSFFAPDLMSYGKSPWSSKYTFDLFKSLLLSRFGSTPSNSLITEQDLKAHQIKPLIQTNEKAAIISGSISADGVGQIRSVYTQASAASISSPAPGSCLLRLKNSQGLQLAEYSFEPGKDPESGTWQFTLILPFDTATARIELLRNGQVIATRNTSNNAPTVAVVYPNGGETLTSSSVTLLWSASDADGDALSYAIEYSKDGGVSWQTLVTNWTSTNFDLSTSSIPGTAQGLIRVLASDGFNTSQDQSNATFSVAKHAPQVNIQAPQANTLFVGSETILLAGSGFDSEDGQLSDDLLAWSSNVNGALGTGHSLTLNAMTLAEGVHTITLTSHDSEGQINSSTTTIQVSRTRPAIPATLSVSAASLDFYAMFGGAQTVPQEISIRNAGDGALNWSANVDQSWIKLNSGSGSAPANVNVSADPTGLAVGQYTGHITVTGATANSPQTITITLTIAPLPKILAFNASSYNVNEDNGSVSVSVSRSGDSSSAATVDYATSDGTARQRRDYTISSGTLKFAAGQATTNLRVLITDNAYVDGDRTLNITLSNPTAGTVLGSPSAVMLTIHDNDTAQPTTNPLDNIDALFFVRQHYYDFLNRNPDPGGLSYWSSQISNCGSDQACLRAKRIDVSNAFFYELEFQQTGSYVFRVYRAAFGNTQPAPNPDANNTNLSDPQRAEARKLPSYSVFANDRARVVGGANLAQGQLDFASAFVQRPEFLTRYPAGLSGPEFVDALLTTLRNDSSADLGVERTALINLYNSGGRGTVLYRLADDNQSNPINNGVFLNAEYNRAFVATQYFGYLRRNADIGGFLFWLGQVNSAALRDVPKQHAMVCSFITSAEYQQRFSPVVTHFNAECGQ